MITDETKAYENNIIKSSYLNPEILSTCIGKTSGNNIFTQSSCRAIWEAFKACFNTEVNVSVSSVSDVFKATLEASVAESMIEQFKIIVSEAYQDEGEWKYHFFYIHELWKKRKLMKMCAFIESSINQATAQEISEQMIDKLSDLTTGEIMPKSFQESIKTTMTSISDVKSGKKTNFISTGIPKLDATGIFQECKEIIIVSQKKCGKTRWLVNMMDRICNLNSNVAIQWYSLEMRAEELIRLFISIKAKVDDYQMTSNSALTTEEEVRIEMAKNYILNYPIEIIDDTVNIYNIISMFAAFCKRHQGRKNVLIIDNLGLIKPHIDNAVLFEDDLARHFKNIRDNQKALVIPVHHMTKESEGRLNKENGYEPKLNNIRGSSRLMDFANSVIILHRPDMYPDLVEEAEKAGRLSDIEGAFLVNVALNRSGPTTKIMMEHDIRFCHFT